MFSFRRISFCASSVFLLSAFALGQMPGLQFPRGNRLDCQITYVQGPANQTWVSVDPAESYDYNSLNAVLAYRQVQEAKQEAFKHMKERVSKYLSNHPTHYCAFQKAVWTTDLSSEKEVTPFVRRIPAEGVHPDFYIEEK